MGAREVTKKEDGMFMENLLHFRHLETLQKRIVPDVHKISSQSNLFSLSLSLYLPLSPLCPK